MKDESNPIGHTPLTTDHLAKGDAAPHNVPVTEIGEQDEALLEQFFAAQRIDIADNGFSQRVMRRLPSRTSRLNRLWTLLCVVLGLVFFFVVRGWQALADAVTIVLRTLPAQDVFQLTPLTIVISLVLLAYMVVFHQIEAEVD